MTDLDAFLFRLACKVSATARDARSKAAVLEQVDWEERYPENRRMRVNLSRIMTYMREDDQENAVGQIIEEHRSMARRLDERSPHKRKARRELPPCPGCGG